jgi:acetyltransferase EpsM
MTRYALIGAGGFAGEVETILNRRQDEGFFYIEDSYGHEVRKNVTVGLHKIPNSMSPVICIGDPRTKKRIAKELGRVFGNIIDPSAVISSPWNVPGLVICPGVVITCNVTIGNHVHINLNSTIGHDCIIGDYCTISPGCNISGNVTLGEGVFLGSGAVVLPGVTIGSWAIIGAGAVVMHDVPEGVTAVGLPAKVCNG